MVMQFQNFDCFTELILIYAVIELTFDVIQTLKSNFCYRNDLFLKLGDNLWLKFIRYFYEALECLNELIFCQIWRFSFYLGICFNCNIKLWKLAIKNVLKFSKDFLDVLLESLNSLFCLYFKVRLNVDCLYIKEFPQAFFKNFAQRTHF